MSKFQKKIPRLRIQRLNGGVNLDDVADDVNFRNMLEDHFVKMLDSLERVELDANDKKVMALKLYEWVDVVDAIRAKHGAVDFSPIIKPDKK